MKLIETKKAVGHVLCHDITQIIPGVTKDAVFRKGHVVRECDIPVLLSCGKEHLYVWECGNDMMHENDAAGVLRDLCLNEGMRASEPKEGKIEIIADIAGLFRINAEELKKINALGEMMIASRHGNFPVKAGDKLAGTRIIPLVISKEKMETAKKIAAGPLFEILPFKKMKVGIVTTGSEVYKGRIEDKFGPAVRKKFQEYDQEILGSRIADDDMEQITRAILDFIDEGADIVACTGGMSVDPDDRTPGAIKNTGAQIVTYGAPVLPGAMFMLSYFAKQDGGSEKKIPVIGLPGCVMYAKRTIFDLVLPRILAGEVLTAEDFCEYGEGGMCLGCKVCRFPECGFGK